MPGCTVRKKNVMLTCGRGQIEPTVNASVVVASSITLVALAYISTTTHSAFPFSNWLQVCLHACIRAWLFVHARTHARARLYMWACNLHRTSFGCICACVIWGIIRSGGSRIVGMIKGWTNLSCFENNFTICCNIWFRDVTIVWELAKQKSYSN